MNNANIDPSGNESGLREARIELDFLTRKQGKSPRTIFSIFDYSRVPDHILLEPMFVVGDNDDFCVDFLIKEGECFEFKPKEAKSKETAIKFYDFDLKETTEEPGSFLASRLEQGQRRGRVYWRKPPEEPANDLPLKDVAIFNLPIQLPKGCKKKLKQTLGRMREQKERGEDITELISELLRTLPFRLDPDLLEALSSGTDEGLTAIEDAIAQFDGDLQDMRLVDPTVVDDGPITEYSRGG